MAGSRPGRYAKSSRHGACYSGGRGFPQERQDSCYIGLTLSRTWEKVLGLASTIARASQGLGIVLEQVEDGGYGQSRLAKVDPVTSSARCC
jgi:hypothetical protein